MAVIVGNDSDDSLNGTSSTDTIRGRGGNDSLQGFGSADTILGGKNDDYIFGGTGADALSGDGESSTTDQPEKGNDVLIGGSGTDTLFAWGDDILVGAGSNQFNTQLISDLKNDTFSVAIAADGKADKFIAVNKDAIDYTLTVVDYEVGVDLIDLSGFGVFGAGDFAEIQDKGNFFEAKTPDINGGELVLRINVDPASLTYI